LSIPDPWSMGDSVSEPLHTLGSLSLRVRMHLDLHGYRSESKRIAACTGKSHCRSRFCPLCIYRRAAREREHLRLVLQALLDTHPTLQLWHVTSNAEDSEEITEHATAAVAGVKKLMNHPQFKGKQGNRIVGWFAALEVATIEDTPCCHVHTLIVSKPLAGAFVMHQSRWNELWFECCSLPMQLTAGITSEDIPRRQRNPSLHHEIPLPLHIRAVPRRDVLYKEKWQSFEQHVLRKLRYVTKEACTGRLSRHVLQQIESNIFISERDALVGVDRFFGSLCRGELSDAKADTMRREVIHAGKCFARKKRQIYRENFVPEIEGNSLPHSLGSFPGRKGREHQYEGLRTDRRLPDAELSG
jgi:hypothetical protein